MKNHPLPQASLELWQAFEKTQILPDRQSIKQELYVHHYRLENKDIGELLYQWTLAEHESLTDAELLRRIGHILERVRGGHDGLGCLVSDINQHFNNVLVHLQDDLAYFPEIDLKLSCYLIAGFDSTQITELLELPSKNMVYTRKHRLLERIKKTSSPYKKFYLTLLE